MMMMVMMMVRFVLAAFSPLLLVSVTLFTFRIVRWISRSLGRGVIVAATISGIRAAPTSSSWRIATPLGSAVRRGAARIVSPVSSRGPAPGPRPGPVSRSVGPPPWVGGGVSPWRAVVPVTTGPSLRIPRNIQRYTKIYRDWVHTVWVLFQGLNDQF